MALSQAQLVLVPNSHSQQGSKSHPLHIKPKSHSFPALGRDTKETETLGSS